MRREKFGGVRRNLGIGIIWDVEGDIGNLGESIGIYREMERKLVEGILKYLGFGREKFGYFRFGGKMK